MTNLLDTDLYDRLGDDGFDRLTTAFYTRVADDELLSPMYPPHDMEGARQRLRDFLIQRFGGPDTYSQQRGHPRLRARHMPYAIDQAARDRWVAHMEAAMAEAELPDDAVPILRQFFEQAATFMINRPG